MGRFVPLRQEMRRHWGGRCAAAHTRASIACVSAGNCGRVRGRPVRGGAMGGCSTGVPRKTFTSDATPSAYGSCARWSVRRNVALLPNSASATTAVTVSPLARTCCSSVTAKRHFSWKRTDGRNPGALALIGCQPLFGQIQARADHPRAHTRPERRRHGHLTIRRLPQCAAVPGAPHRPSACPVWESWCRRESARRFDRGSRPAAGATAGRPSTARR